MYMLPWTSPHRWLIEMLRVQRGTGVGLFLAGGIDPLKKRDPGINRHTGSCNP